MAGSGADECRYASFCRPSKESRRSISVWCGCFDLDTKTGYVYAVHRVHHVWFVFHTRMRSAALQLTHHEETVTDGVGHAHAAVLSNGSLFDMLNPQVLQVGLYVRPAVHGTSIPMFRSLVLVLRRLDHCGGTRRHFQVKRKRRSS